MHAPRTPLRIALALLASGSLLLSSVAVAQNPPVPDEHPRVYVRGADLPAIQARLQDPAFADAWDEVQQSDTALARAFEYLVTGDAAAGQEGVALGLADLQACDDARVFDQAMHWAACIYDWCYPLLSADDKQAYIAEFERIAASHDPGYPADPAASAVVGHVTEGWLLSAQLPAGIAIHDESATMYDAAATLFLGRFAEVRDFYYPAHMHHQGDSYVSRFAHDQAASWLFRRLGAGDVLSPEQAGVPYQLLYNLRPDGQQMRSGDTYDDRGMSQSKRLIAMLTGSYYDDPHLLWMADSDLFWDPPVYYRILELLFRASSSPVAAPDSLPATKYFPMPMGEMVARTGWTLGTDSPDTVVHMRIGGSFFGNHQRKDWGTFQLYHRGPLAISSGVYEGDGSPYGSDHWLNYHHQTIAHNGLLIFDPAEAMTKNGTATANDGGQRWPEGTDHPPDLATLASEEYSFGQVTARAVGPDSAAPKFSYLAGDITGAYAKQKVTTVTRAMAALHAVGSPVPVRLVVFDRVVATNPAFEKTWLLHTIQEPTIDGSRFSVVRDGPTWDGEGTYGGKLVVDALLPSNPSLRTVGGPGKEFWVEGAQTNYAVTKGDAAEPGAWRVEVSPSVDAAEDTFLHVLHAMDSSVPDPAQAELIEGQGLVGALSSGWGALFSATGATLDSGSFAWNGDGDLHVLVCDLEPGWWTISRNGSVVGSQQVLQDEGVLWVEGPAGDYELTPGAPPDGGTLPDGAAPEAGGESDGGAQSDGAAGAGGGSGGAGLSPTGGGDDSGCGCRTAPVGETTSSLLALIGILTLARRRRSGSERSLQR